MKIIQTIYHKYLFYSNKLRIKKLKILATSIGRDVISYGRFSVVNAVNLKIGESTTINEGVHINCRDKVTIGKDVHIPTNVQIHTGKLILKQNPRFHSKEQIIIKDNVWLATNVVVLSSVTIGENSVIGASCVITKDIPSNSLVMGIPAKIIRKI